MQICGSRVRNFFVLLFNRTILSAFHFHDIESPLFWNCWAGTVVFCAFVIIGLELVRFMVPGFAAGWWDLE